MGLGDFTAENAQSAYDGVDEMFKAIPKKKQGEFLGHLNEISLFLATAKGIAQAQAQTAETPAPAPVEPAGATPGVGDRAQCFTND